MIRPAIESFEPNRMTITNLIKQRNELMSLADMMGRIETDTLLLYFTRSSMVNYFILTTQRQIK